MDFVAAARGRNRGWHETFVKLCMSFLQLCETILCFASNAPIGGVSAL
jgi:hypothetical protein